MIKIVVEFLDLIKNVLKNCLYVSKKNLKNIKYLELQKKDIIKHQSITQANHERDPIAEATSIEHSFPDPTDHDFKKSGATTIGGSEPYDVEKELEDELEKDLEGLNINDVDTADVNLEDEDLLEDQFQWPRKILILYYPKNQYPNHDLNVV